MSYNKLLSVSKIKIIDYLDGDKGDESVAMTSIELGDVTNSTDDSKEPPLCKLFCWNEDVDIEAGSESGVEPKISQESVDLRVR